MSKSELVPQDQSVRLSKAKLLILVFGLQTALFISFIDSTSVSTILPIIGRDLDAAESVTWAGTAFLVANTSFQIITSRLSDVFGRKIVLLGSLFLFGFGDLVAGFAENKVWLYAARAVAGIGGGGINSLSMIILSDVVTVRERGKYLSLLGIGIASGSAAGPFLGAVLAQKAYWGWAFWIIAPLAAFTMTLVWFTVPQKQLEGGYREKVQTMDWLGGFLSLTMTVCILVSIIGLAKKDTGLMTKVPLSGGGSTFAWDSAVVIGLFVAGGLAIGAFIYVEGRMARLPLFPGRLLYNRNICLLIIQTWLVGMVFYGGIYFTPLYFQGVLGESPIMSATLLLPLVVSQVVTTAISGYVIKYTNKAWSSFFVGFLVWSAGQGAQLCFDENTPKGVLVAVLLLQGLGIGLTIQSTLLLAQVSGPPEDRAVVTGVRNFARTSGGAVGLAVGNAILQNGFVKNLPSDLAPRLRQRLVETLEIPDELDSVTTLHLRQAYMTALYNVFIFFVPVIGVCLVMCAFLKDIPLSEPKLRLPTHSTAESTDAVVLPADASAVEGPIAALESKEPLRK